MRCYGNLFKSLMFSVVPGRSQIVGERHLEGQFPNMQERPRTAGNVKNNKICIYIYIFRKINKNYGDI